MTRKITAFFSSLLPSSRWNSPEACYDLFQDGGEGEGERESPRCGTQESRHLAELPGQVNLEAYKVLKNNAGFPPSSDEERRVSVPMEKEEQDTRPEQGHGAGAELHDSAAPALLELHTRSSRSVEARAETLLAGNDPQTLTCPSTFLSAWKPTMWGSSQQSKTDEREGREEERDALRSRDLSHAQQFWWALRDRQEPRGEASVYFLTSQHCHAKNIVVDHLWSTVGSFNFDRHVDS